MVMKRIEFESADFFQCMFDESSLMIKISVHSLTFIFRINRYLFLFGMVVGRQ
jgi:hypothetical protein